MRLSPQPKHSIVVTQSCIELMHVELWRKNYKVTSWCGIVRFWTEFRLMSRPLWREMKIFRALRWISPLQLMLTLEEKNHLLCTKGYKLSFIDIPATTWTNKQISKQTNKQTNLTHSSSSSRLGHNDITSPLLSVPAENEEKKTYWSNNIKA